MELAGECNRCLVAGLLFTDAMPLQFNEDVLLTKGLDQPSEHPAALVHAAALKGGGERAFITTGHADETFGGS